MRGSRDLRRLAMSVVLISVLALSVLLGPSPAMEGSPGGERVTFDLALPVCTISFELPQGYHVTDGRVKGPPVYRTQAREGKSVVSEWGADTLGFSARGVLVDYERTSGDPCVLLKKEPDADWEAMAFQEGPVDVIGEGDATYPGYYILVHEPAEPGQHGMFASTEGHLMVVLEPKGAGAVHFAVSFLDTEDHTINGDTVTYTIDGQSPIAKHKADVASMVASVRISWQPQQPSQIPTAPAKEAVPEETTSAMIIQAKGEAFVREPGSNDWKPVSPAGEAVPVTVGSTVRTDQGSVRLKDLPGQGDVVLVGENTQVQIEDRGSLYSKAVRSYCQGKLEESMVALEEHLSIEPTDQKAQNLLRRIKQDLGIIERPESSFSTSESKELYFSGLRLYGSGEWKEAVIALEKCLAIDPTNSKASQALERIKDELSRSIFSTEESRSFYDEARREFDAGELQKAVAALNNCLAIDPTNSLARFTLEEVEFQLKLKSEMPEEQGTILDVLVGKIRAVIGKLKSKSRFDVRTPVCILGVRGTDFIVDATQERTEVLVFEGTVELSDLERHKTVLVEAGQSSVVLSGGLPSEPQRYSKDDVYQEYQSLFESEIEMKAVLEGIEEPPKDREAVGFPFYLLAIPAAVIVLALILVIRRMRRASARDVVHR